MSSRLEKHIAARLRRAEAAVFALLEPTEAERKAGGKIKAREVVAEDGELATVARAIPPDSDDEVEP